MTTKNYFADAAATSSIASEQAMGQAIPIYQERTVNGLWQDVSKELHDSIVSGKFRSEGVRIVYAAPSPAAREAGDGVSDSQRRAVIEECCAAIKAEDDRQVANDYMLDSDDCIRVIRALSQKKSGE